MSDSAQLNRVKDTRGALAPAVGIGIIAHRAEALPDFTEVTCQVDLCDRLRELTVADHSARAAKGQLTGGLVAVST